MGVDSYYIAQKHDALREDTSDNGEWRFTVAQWATSVCYERPDDLIPERRSKVNDYLLRLVKGDIHWFHQLLMGAFWMSQFDEPSRFIFEVKPQPYEADKFVSIAKIWLKRPRSGQLSDQQDNDLRLFINDYDRWLKKEAHTNKSEPIEGEVVDER